MKTLYNIINNKTGGPESVMPGKVFWWFLGPDILRFFNLKTLNY